MDHRHAWGILLVSALVLLHSSSHDALQPVEDPPLAKVAPGAGPRVEPPPTGSELLASRRLAVPVEGVPRSRLRDTFNARRGKGRTHEAIDIMAPWGTPVLAADDGKVAKITSNRGGGLALYQVDGSGRFVYYYAHLAGYADGLQEGQQVRRGDVIAYVGATGNASKDAPHLHFAVLLLARERRWWGGEALNPYHALARSETVTAGNP
jgi:murein DD-endopeptidase MepM/ murein hydrolase activator NlpD